jgi:dipeptidyl aminopeptidase/acylaminoacyl peptidase
LHPIRPFPRRITFVLGLTCALASQAAWAGRPLAPEDWFRFQDVSDLKIAPDGASIAYLVTGFDKESDESRSALWMADWAGTQSVQLTRGESVSEPRFSPDGRYLSFLSARPAEGKAQLWVLDRRGGEPRQLSHVSGEVSSYEWSPDGQSAVLVMHAGEDPKAHKPWVIDALRFKADKDGYLTAESRSHLCLLDVRSGTCSALASDPERADSLPAFSPDGRRIAYVSNRAGAPGELGVDEVYLVAAAGGSRPQRLLSTWSPNKQRLEWSPDGTLIAFLQGTELKYNAYIMDTLAVAEVKSGDVRALTGSLDRAVLSRRPFDTVRGRG